MGSVVCCFADAVLHVLGVDEFRCIIVFDSSSDSKLWCLPESVVSLVSLLTSLVITTVSFIMLSFISSVTILISRLFSIPSLSSSAKLLVLSMELNERLHILLKVNDVSSSSSSCSLL
uniref:Uncharacterized protein n=1 Tax=Cacopsylla melanoneura TaxID=428564 RepID=A0A8D8Q6J0_9HEMI